MRQQRTINGDMSTFLGFNCLRSSPTLGRIVRSCAAQTATSAEHSLTLLRPKRCFSSLGTRASRKTPTALEFRLIQPQWRQQRPSRRQQTRTLFGFASRRDDITTEYIHLPKTYRDEEGLPFQENEELSLGETSTIFPGMNVSPDRAYKLLKILHGRRVAGTLDDPSLAANTADYSAREIKKALKYLRETVPVDEILNAGLRAEDELRQLENDPEFGEATGKDTAAPADKAQDDRRALYGESVLDRMRAKNIARREAEERAEAEQRKREEEQAAQNWGGLAPYDHKLHHGLKPQQIEHYEAATSDLEAPPDTPLWRLLLPTTAFFFAVLGALYLLVDLVPPRPGKEVLEGFKDSRITVGSIVLANALIFLAWKRVRLWKFLNQHFILDYVTPRPYQLVTSLFSHQKGSYILSNMAWLVLGGTLFADEVGPLPFLATYLASGMAGSWVSMIKHLLHREYAYSIGASSASFGVVCAYFWLYRFDGFKILGLPPDPLQGIQGLGVIGMIVTFFALVPMARRRMGDINNLSHLLGMLTGIGAAGLIEKRWKAAKAESMLTEAETEGKDPAAAVTVKADQKKS